MNDQRLQPEGPDAVLLIDWENIKSSLNSRGMRPSVAAIRDACSRFGRIVLARAYADWQDGWVRDDPRDLYAVGIEPVYVPVRRYREDDGRDTIKNSVDVRLASDCIEMIHTHPQIQVFILATGDSDFLHVVNKLRPYGKQVVALAVSWSASPRLAEAVDHVVYYDRDIEPPMAPSGGVAVTEMPLTVAVSESAPALAQQQTDALAAPVAPLSSEAPSDELDIVEHAVHAIVMENRSKGRKITVSALGKDLQEALGMTNFRILVSGKLQRILLGMAGKGLLQLDRRGVDDWIYLPGEEMEAVADVPRPTPPPRATGERLRWDSLDADVKALAIRQVRDAELNPQLDWLTFNRIAEALHEIQPWVIGRDLANGMVSAGILVEDQERVWYDAFTGNKGVYHTMILNRDSPDVIAVLGPRE